MRSKKILLGAFAVILLAVGLTSTIFLSQRRQETRTHASASTTLSFSPSTTPSNPFQKNLGEATSLDVFVDPGNNRPSIIKLEILYDPSKMSPTSNPFVVNTAAFPATREGPYVQNGKILITVSIDSDPTHAISQITKVGTVNFTANSPTLNGPTSLAFGSSSQVLSVGANDQATENVLSTSSPAYINIIPPSTPTPTPIPQNQNPLIKITNPVNGTLININYFPVYVNASDPDGLVSKVDYYLNNTLVNTSTISPFTGSINLPQTGTCSIKSGTIKAVATDDHNATSSDTVTISWNDSCAPTPTPQACGGANQACCNNTPACQTGLFCSPDTTTGTLDKCQPIASPTPTQSTIPPTPTPTPPTASTPTPTNPPGSATISFDVLIHGIGSGGDNANPTLNSFSNKYPVHQTRNMKVEILDAQNNLIGASNSNLIYNPGGSFIGSVAINTFPGSGSYTIKLTSPTHLRKQIPGIQNIIVGQNNSMPQISLIAGDVNTDNSINILDYNLLIGCYSDLAPATSCSTENKVISDLNDDGSVNQGDYNLFLREITVQVGQ